MHEFVWGLGLGLAKFESAFGTGFVSILGDWAV